MREEGRGKLPANGLLHGLVIALTLSCQPGERRESTGEVAVTLPTTPVPVPTLDADVQRAQIELAEGRATLATRIVMPAVMAMAQTSPATASRCRPDG